MITANKNEWSIARDASKFRKLYGSLPQSSKRDGEEIHETENDTNEQLYSDEHDGETKTIIYKLISNKITKDGNR